MQSEWRVTNNPMMAPTPYGVYRLRDTQAVDHSGNRENYGEYFGDRKDAEAVAKALNEEEKDGTKG